MPHNAVAAMLDMLVAARRAVNRLANTTEEEFLVDEDAQWFMFSQIVIIGEAANRVDGETRARYAHIPWSAAISMRHRMVHGYDSIDWRIVYATVKYDLPALIEALKAVVPPET
ncbi:MAG: DUF86 domain-containing protein [Armatimonadota bacterium]|nr:DUF86 domain-containing protein [bacterium]MDW8321490.1 DUF86 domain-containing protein [Armatimonadota bacterium]